MEKVLFFFTAHGWRAFKVDGKMANIKAIEKETVDQAKEAFQEVYNNLPNGTYTVTFGEKEGSLNTSKSNYTFQKNEVNAPSAPVGINYAPVQNNENLWRELMLSQQKSTEENMKLQLELIKMKFEYEMKIVKAKGKDDGIGIKELMQLFQAGGQQSPAPNVPQITPAAPKVENVENVANVAIGTANELSQFDNQAVQYVRKAGETLGQDNVLSLLSFFAKMPPQQAQFLLQYVEQNQ